MDDGDSDRLPVFLSVSEIEFPVTERSPRRVIAIYNTYGYPIQYKVLCNAPGNYSVPNFKGMLLAKSCKDLVVRCTAKLTVGTTDRLRIEIMRPGKTETLGSHDILLRTVSESGTTPSHLSRSMGSGMDGRRSCGSSSQVSARIRDENAASSQLVCLGVVMLCAVTLMAPTQGDPGAANSLLPRIVSILLLRPMT
ncbi:unnamed protein product [Heligmosomoides polygyrus]|uniref:Motile sperm domain-containing protein 1 n=1 Tax=Heligmosomoides polygyrus TaxID=6339 RepID=A0A183GVA3_HELPZ|nr:unnamed protein product [Heligmosomoides polygyrus]